MVQSANNTYILRTMGCQMNERDSELISGILESLGYVETEELESAGLIVYNTCCVRENPERKVYGQISALKRLKKDNPNLIIAIGGCMPQQEQELQTLKRRLTHVDLFFGTHNIHRLPQLLKQVGRGQQIVEILSEKDQLVEGELPEKRKHGFKAFVNIVYGCTNFCSYCIVPYVRGRERSRDTEEILNEIQQLAAKGYREVTLLGQNVNAYGKDLPQSTSFAALLQQIDEVSGIDRIRFTTSHPRDLDDRLIETISNQGTICEHIHLPVQSGSNQVLKAMNRGYTREYYMELAAKLNERIPNLALTTDIIVGFPGETEADFNQTMELVKSTGFANAFTFIYSIRNGTPAATMTNQVPERVKKERIYRLIELQNQISARLNQEMVNQIEEVLVEGKDPDTGQLVGRTRSNRLVVFPGNSDLVGHLVPVKITLARTWSLQGELDEET